MEKGREEKNETVKDTELELERLTGELTAEHLNIVEKFAATIDIGYEYFEADTWCRLLYFPLLSPNFNQVFGPQNKTEMS